MLDRCALTRTRLTLAKLRTQIVDPLSDVLRVIRLTSTVFFSARLEAPWAVASPSAADLAAALGLRGDGISLFHLVAEGRCSLAWGEVEPVEVDAGTIIIFPHGGAHAMMSRPGLDPLPLTSVLPSVLEAPGERIPRFTLGHGGTTARLVCGYLHCDQRFNPLAGALPALLVADARRGSLAAAATLGSRLTSGPRPQPDAADAHAGDWLDRTFRYTVAEAESARPGARAMVARLVELLYVAVLRQYTQQLPARSRGWLAAVRDAEVGRALRLLHAHPGRRWTVEALARAVGLSRSALARRFTRLCGEPPMHYLAGWRMQLAQQLLAEPALSVAQVATRVGFDSDVAFNRAFRRRVGRPPATWRRVHGGVSDASGPRAANAEAP